MNNNLCLKGTAIVINRDGSIASVHDIGPKINKQSYVTTTIKNAKGEIIRTRTTAMKSFVANLLHFLYYHCTAATSSGIKDTAGNTHSSVCAEFDLTGDAADSTHGIHIGTDSTTPAATDYAMAAKIAHGTGAGQMSYGATTVGSCAVDGNNYKLTVTRSFTNSSGGPITVKEAGLVFKFTATPSLYYLIARDLINGVTGYVVANGQTIDITYTIYIVSANGFTQQFLKLLRVGFNDASAEALTDTTGASITSVSPIYGFSIRALAADDAYGVVIGTSDAAIDAALYCLGTKLLTASFTHQVWESAAVAVVSDTTSFVLKRTFTNVSGGAITVEEAGIYGFGKGPGHYVMLARTLTGGIVVGDSQSIQISYTFEVTT